MSPKINLGIIGAGRIGRVHAENLAYRVPNANVLAISDVHLPAAEQCAADFGIPQAYRDHQPVLADDRIDAVLICSSTDTHAQFITEAAQAGKHIFCEKPIALNLADIDRALAAVAAAGVKLQIGFNRRFDPNFKQVRAEIAAGAVGEPHIVRITSRDPAPPPIEYIKVSGGIFLDMTIHDFDMARFLVDSEIEEVFVAAASLVDPAIGAAGDVDTAIITLKYANGALGAIDNSRQTAYGYDQRVEVFGSKGMVAAENDTPHRAVRSDAEGVHSAKPLYFFLERYTAAYTAEMQSFVDVLLNDAPVPVTGADGRAAVAIGLAAKKSWREKRPVKISEIG